MDPALHHEMVGKEEQKMSKKPCKYHCEYSDGQYCQRDGECVMSVMNNPVQKKPPLGCSPYYVSASARICELCEAIKRNSAEAGSHNQIKLWAAEIQYLNEMDRMLRRVEAENTWVEEKDGTLKEVE